MSLKGWFLKRWCLEEELGDARVVLKIIVIVIIAVSHGYDSRWLYHVNNTFRDINLCEINIYAAAGSSIKYLNLVPTFGALVEH